MLDSVLEFLAGLGIFLVGVKLLSGGLEKIAGSKFRKYIDKFTKNIFGGFSFGTLMAVVTQSSMASVVMTMSFATAGIISIFQALAFVFGSNVGTSISTIIVAFNSISLSKFFAVLGIVGVLISIFSKKSTVKNWGYTIAGLGLIFAGLNVLSGASLAFRESDAFMNFIEQINNPYLYFIFGIALTLLTHSSTATIALLVSIVASTGFGGAISLTSVAFCVYGSNVGTALTTLSVSLSSSTEAKKVSFIHILFNILGCVIFIPLTYTNWLNLIEVLNINNSFKIVFINIIFNLVSALIFLPFSKLFIKLTNSLIKDRKSKLNKIYVLDDSMLKTPYIVINNLNLCLLDLVNKLSDILNELKTYCENFESMHSKSIRLKVEEVLELNSKIISNYMKIQTYIESDEEMEKLFFIQTTSKNYERILKNYLSILTYVKDNKENKIYFTQKQIKQFHKTFNYLYDIIENTKIIMNNYIDNIDRKEYFLPSLLILQRSDEIDNIKSNIKREIMEGSFSNDKRIEKYTMFINVINSLSQIAENFSDISLQVTNIVTKNKEI